MVLYHNHTYYKVCLMKILCVVELINMVLVSDFKNVSETYRLQKYTKEFTKEKGNKQSKAKNFILTLLYTWLAHGTVHTGLAYKHLSHCGTPLYPNVDKNTVQCVCSGGDSLLHIGICCKSNASQMSLKGPKDMGVSGHDIVTVGSVVHTSWPQYHKQSRLGCSDFHLLDLITCTTLNEYTTWGSS